MKRNGKNILFIMADQLRFDYLSCYGHPTLKTPNIDRLAKAGVKFTRAYCQSPVCGPSRMSFYTGRYVRSHGSTYNNVPLRAGEKAMGDHLRPLGVDTYLLGKTHMTPDYSGLDRYEIPKDNLERARTLECGFDVIEREEGVYPDTPGRQGEVRSPYNDYLRQNGYAGANPWHEWVNSAEIDGEIVSGWLLDTNDQPCRAAAEHTETAYLTQRAISTIDGFGETPWCLHLSYIKPHWPYLAPNPYHALYDDNDVLPVVRSDEELRNAHPVFKAFHNLRVSQSFCDDAIRKKVARAYMGLVKQIDDQLGVLFDALQERGLMDNTMIVFTSDHGDYLGDHWLGEKDFVHETAIRIPLIVYDPRSEADSSRGSDCNKLVESIDLLPTFIEFAGGEAASPWLQGRSLMPLLEQNPGTAWRETAFSEYDYSIQAARQELESDLDDSYYIVAITEQHKLIYFPTFRPMLFDLSKDPQELVDISQQPESKPIIDGLMSELVRWLSKPNRVTESRASRAKRTNTQLQRGLWIGVKDMEHYSSALQDELESKDRRG